MAKRRARLVPKVVFRAAVTATAVPLLVGCREPRYGVADMSYGTVAQRAYEPMPDGAAVELPAPTTTTSASSSATATVPPPLDASAEGSAGALDAGKLDAGKLDAGKPDAGKLDAGKLAAGKQDAAAGVLTPPPPLGVAYRGYDEVGVAYRGYQTSPSAGPGGPKPPAKP
jgi:hypothetical protein